MSARRSKKPRTTAAAGSGKSYALRNEGRFVPAEPGDLKLLYARYMAPGAWPVLVDIAGPTPLLTFVQFQDYCEALENVWVLKTLEGLGGFCLVTDVQSELALANVELGFFGQVPRSGSTLAQSLAWALNQLCRHKHLTRLALLAFRKDRAKIRLMRGLGFKQEGLLREHFFHENAWHDMIVLGRLEERRRGA